MMVTVDGRLLRGERTRAAVLDTAIAYATEVGLEGLSLGQLAERLSVSKSGLFAHWKSKEELQLATIERARERFVASTVTPALKFPRGVRRLWALYGYRLADIEATSLPGGCFFTNAQFEYDARPGPVRDRIAEALREWLALNTRLAAEAVTAGELVPGTDPALLAFELDAFSCATVYTSRLLSPDTVFTHARAAGLSRLRGLCTNPELLPEV